MSLKRVIRALSLRSTNTYTVRTSLAHSQYSCEHCDPFGLARNTREPPRDCQGHGVNVLLALKDLSILLCVCGTIPRWSHAGTVAPFTPEHPAPAQAAAPSELPTELGGRFLIAKPPRDHCARKHRFTPHHPFPAWILSRPFNAFSEQQDKISELLIIKSAFRPQCYVIEQAPTSNTQTFSFSFSFS